MRIFLIFLSIIFMFLFKGNAQGMVVHDPGNAANLVTVATVLEEMDRVAKETASRFKDLEAVKKVHDLSKLIKTIDETACVLRDLDLYSSMAGEQYNGCFVRFETQMSLQGLNNAISQMTTGMAGSLIAADDRIKMIGDAIDDVRENTKKLNDEKLRLQAKVENKEHLEELAGFFSNGGK